jgi:hypothetical protein
MDTTVPPQTTEFSQNEFYDYTSIIGKNNTYTYIDTNDDDYINDNNDNNDDNDNDNDNDNTRPTTPLDQPTDKTMPGAPEKKREA